MKKSKAETAGFGIAGVNCKSLKAAVGIAGIDRERTSRIAETAGFGIAGELRGQTGEVVHYLQAHDRYLGQINGQSDRLGDRAARAAYRHGFYFIDYSFLSTPYGETAGGGYSRNGHVRWRKSKKEIFGHRERTLPLLVDSSGYRREISGSAPLWSHELPMYLATLELVDADGFAAWDYPNDRDRSLQALREMIQVFPQDSRLWPVFSARWTWQDNARVRLPRRSALAGHDADLIPLNRTQRTYKRETRARWARQTIANALILADDPDFRWMVETFGRVMIGGMIGSRIPRMARHLYAAVLCEMFPDAQFWLLGQANFVVINGLGSLGLLHRVFTDGSWWIKEATAERFAVVEDGLLTIHSIGRRDRKRTRASFFTTAEMMAANLRAIMSAYAGLWTWPKPEPIPLDFDDPEQVAEMQRRLRFAQLELGL